MNSATSASRTALEAALELCFDTSLATLGGEVVAIMHEGEMVYL